MFVFLTDVTSQHKYSPNDANGLCDGRRQSIFHFPKPQKARTYMSFLITQDFILENWPSQRMQEAELALAQKEAQKKELGEKNMGIHLCVCVTNHFAVYLDLTQHCKSTRQQ